MIIRPVAPFRLDLTVWALRRRGRNTIDRWDGTTYRRVVVIEGRPTEIVIRQAGSHGVRTVDGIPRCWAMVGANRHAMGLGRLHVFPGDDVGAQKSLARWLGRSAPLDYGGVRKAVAPRQPYAGLVYFHLLLDGLSNAGVLESVA